MDGAYSGVSSTATSEWSSWMLLTHQAKDSKPFRRPNTYKLHSLRRSAGSASSAQTLVLDWVFLLRRCAAEAVLLDLPRAPPVSCARAACAFKGVVLLHGWRHSSAYQKIALGHRSASASLHRHAELFNRYGRSSWLWSRRRRRNDRHRRGPGDRTADGSDQHSWSRGASQHRNRGSEAVVVLPSAASRASFLVGTG